MKNFLKKADLQLINGGYVCDSKENPVTNLEFIKAQQHAEYIVTFAEMAKEKDFKGKKADCLIELTASVKNALKAKDTVYVKAPSKVKKPLTKQLADEAMAFMSFEKDTSKVEKINLFLKQFDSLNEFETFGLFFEPGIVKLNKIYKMKEIIEAVKETIDILD